MSKNLVLFAVLGLLGFLAYKQFSAQQSSAPGLPPPQTSNPNGGSQTAGAQDLFTQIVSVITSIADATKTIAQQSSKNT